VGHTPLLQADRAPIQDHPSQQDMGGFHFPSPLTFFLVNYARYTYHARSTDHTHFSRLPATLQNHTHPTRLQLLFINPPHVPKHAHHSCCSFHHKTHTLYTKLHCLVSTGPPPPTLSSLLGDYQHTRGITRLKLINSTLTRWHDLSCAPCSLSLHCSDHRKCRSMSLQMIQTNLSGGGGGNSHKKNI